jgi:hypothetical protein
MYENKNGFLEREDVRVPDAHPGVPLFVRRNEDLKILRN